MTSTSTSGFYVGDDDEPEKYRLARQVGRGGEASLWLGYVSVSGGDEMVAVKILNPEHSDDIDRLRERWAEQVETLRFVADPGVVQVRDWFVGATMHRAGVASPSGGRALYLVMNWVDGRSFRDWVAIHEGRAGWIDGLGKLSQVARTLDDLHAGRSIPSGRSVIHGDLSPGNVMITPEDQAILVDFGLVRLADHHTAHAMGTPGFVAPEIWSSGHYTPAADRYSFAALGYFALLGEAPPFDTREIHQRLFAHPMLCNAPSPRVHAIMRGFDPSPDTRPRAGEWLESLRDGATTSSRNTVVPGPEPVPTRRPPLPAPAARAPSSGLRYVVIGAGSAVAAVVVLLVVLAGIRSGNSTGNQPGGATALPTTVAPAPTTTTPNASTAGSTGLNGSAPSAPTYTGPVRMTSDGFVINAGKPAPANGGYPTEWRSDGTVDINSGPTARWPSATTPTSEQCAAQIATQSYSNAEQGAIPFEPGLGLCFETGGGSDSSRYQVFMRLPRTPAQPAIQVDVTVWRTPVN